MGVIFWLIWIVGFFALAFWHSSMHGSPKLFTGLGIAVNVFFMFGVAVAAKPNLYGQVNKPGQYWALMLMILFVGGVTGLIRWLLNRADNTAYRSRRRSSKPYNSGRPQQPRQPQTPQQVHSIQTEYNGILFMSALEADWAASMDTYHIPWGTEPEGIVLPDGQNYRPDFLLEPSHTWLEVKGAHDERIDKPMLLAQGLLHAPGCQDGRPSAVLQRPYGVAAPSCWCGCGPDIPYMLVVVGRANRAGKLWWESPINTYPGQQILLAQCPTCNGLGWTLSDGATASLCRYCHQALPPTANIWGPGTVPMTRLEPTIGGVARR